jgi:predicted transcriptional regulator
MSKNLSLEEQTDIETSKRLANAAAIASAMPKTEEEYARAIRRFEERQGANRGRLPSYTTINLGVEARQAQREDDIIDALQENGLMRRRALAIAIGCDAASVKDYIRPLVAEGIVTRTYTKASGAEYILTKDVNETNQLNAPAYYK